MLWWSRIRWNGPAVRGCLLSTINSVRVSVCSCRRITPCSSIWKHRIFFFVVFCKTWCPEIEGSLCYKAIFFLKVATRWQSHAALTLSNVLTVSSSIVACVMMLMSMSASYLQEDFKDLLSLTHTGHKGTQTWHAGWHRTICWHSDSAQPMLIFLKQTELLNIFFCFLFFEWYSYFLVSMSVVCGCGCLGVDVVVRSTCDMLELRKDFIPLELTGLLGSGPRNAQHIVFDVDNLDLCLWEM